MTVKYRLKSFNFSFLYFYIILNDMTGKQNNVYINIRSDEVDSGVCVYEKKKKKRWQKIICRKNRNAGIGNISVLIVV